LWGQKFSVEPAVCAFGWVFSTDVLLNLPQAANNNKNIESCTAVVPYRMPRKQRSYQQNYAVADPPNPNVT